MAAISRWRLKFLFEEYRQWIKKISKGSPVFLRREFRAIWEGAFHLGDQCTNRWLYSWRDTNVSWPISWKSSFVHAHVHLKYKQRIIVHVENYIHVARTETTRFIMLRRIHQEAAAEAKHHRNECRPLTMCRSKYSVPIIMNILFSPHHVSLFVITNFQ